MAKRRGVDSAAQPPAKDRILESATREFRENGFAGARVERIANLAGVNKQVIYYYFANKRELYNSVLLSILGQSQSRTIADNAESLPELQSGWRDGSAELGKTWARFLVWEAVTWDGGDVLRQAERQGAAYSSFTSRIERAQAKGTVPEDLEAALLSLTFFAANMLPLVLPQVVRLVTGMDLDDPDFIKRYEATLQRLWEGLALQAQTLSSSSGAKTRSPARRRVRSTAPESEQSLSPATSPRRTDRLASTAAPRSPLGRS